MKKLITLTFLTSFAIMLVAQIRLDVEGDVKIRGKLDMSIGTANLFIGENAGQSNLTGVNNTFLGVSAGISNTTNNNTFIGSQAGNNNDDGTSNTFIGVNTGFNNISASNNTFIGFQAGLTNGITGGGISNTFIGALAGLSNRAGQNNTFIGFQAGNINSTGNFNTFIGNDAGSKNTIGVANTFLGYNAGLENTSATFNVFIGYETGKNCTEAGDGGATTSASVNTMVGANAGINTTLGTQNVFLGANAGNGNTNGDSNVFVGYSTGASAANGSFQTFVGHNVNALVGTSTENSFAIGQNTMVTAPNAGILGNASTQKVGSTVNWSSISDGRFKKKIKEDVKGLEFILQLRPVTYQIQAEKLYSFTKNDQVATVRASNSQTPLVTETSPILKKALAEKSKITYSGFVAQEVEKAAKKSGFNFSGVVKPRNAKDPYGIRYAEFTVPLVKAIQEQQIIIEDLKLENQKQQQELVAQRKALRQLQKEMQAYKTLLDELIANKTTNPKIDNQTLILERKASLSQNHPNPFQQQTIVNYYIPKNVQKAKLQVMTVDGKILGIINIDGKSEGQATIETATYPSGIYYYALVLDGQIYETKRMLLAHK